MRKVLGILAVSAVLGVTLFGCDAPQGPAKAPAAVGTAAPGGGGPATAKGGTPSTVAPAPEANPDYHGAAGSKIK